MNAKPPRVGLIPNNVGVETAACMKYQGSPRVKQPMQPYGQYTAISSLDLLEL
jgi:hypothetical protein